MKILKESKHLSHKQMKNKKKHTKERKIYKELKL